jgi:glutamate racemase
LEARALIGVFDSGIGGLSVLRALRRTLPQHDFVYFADTGHAPYGERGDAHVLTRTRAVVRDLQARWTLDAMVIACNTATAAAINAMRLEHPALPLIGVEPAIRPAAELTRTGRVAVLATRGTLSSARYAALRASLGTGVEFVDQACDGLAEAIEREDSAAVQALCTRYLQACGPMGTAPGCTDTVVLGCTHYPFAQEQLAAAAGPQVRFIETGEAVARQTGRVLAAAGKCRTGQGRLELRTTGSLQNLEAAAARWLY